MFELETGTQRYLVASAASFVLAWVFLAGFEPGGTTLAWVVLVLGIAIWSLAIYGGHLVVEKAKSEFGDGLAQMMAQLPIAAGLALALEGLVFLLELWTNLALSEGYVMFLVCWVSGLMLFFEHQGNSSRHSPLIIAGAASVVFAIFGRLGFWGFVGYLFFAIPLVYHYWQASKDEDNSWGAAIARTTRLWRIWPF